jgi:hypothetical protein
LGWAQGFCRYPWDPRDFCEIQCETLMKRLETWGRLRAQPAKQTQEIPLLLSCWTDYVIPLGISNPPALLSLLSQRTVLATVMTLLKHTET